MSERRTVNKREVVQAVVEIVIVILVTGSILRVLPGRETIPGHWTWAAK